MSTFQSTVSALPHSLVAVVSRVFGNSYFLVFRPISALASSPTGLLLCLPMVNRWRYFHDASSRIYFENSLPAQDAKTEVDRAKAAWTQVDKLEEGERSHRILEGYDAMNKGAVTDIPVRVGHVAAGASKPSDAASFHRLDVTVKQRAGQWPATATRDGPAHSSIAEQQAESERAKAARKQVDKAEEAERSHSILEGYDAMNKGAVVDIPVRVGHVVGGGEQGTFHRPEASVKHRADDIDASLGLAQH